MTGMATAGSGSASKKLNDVWTSRLGLAMSADAALLGSLKIASSGCTDGVGVICVWLSSTLVALDASACVEEAVRHDSESLDELPLPLSSPGWAWSSVGSAFD